MTAASNEPAVERDVLILVGNGLSVNYGYHVSPALDEWNTSKPLAWEVRDPSPRTATSGAPAPLLEVLPKAAQALDAARIAQSADASDFDLINTAATIAEATFGDDAHSALVELRHLVALLFSHYQFAADRLSKRGWALGEYIQKLALSGKLVGAVSMNYDLNLESLIEDTGLRIFDVNAYTSTVGHIPIVKPHGSIDYVPDRIVEFAPEIVLTYPTWFFSSGVNTPAVRKLPRGDWISVRTSVDLVLPAEESKISKFQWVNFGTRWLAEACPGVKTLLIIGISYMEPDRPELNDLLGQLSPDTHVAVYDPKPSPELVDFLHSRFDSVDLWGLNLKPLHDEPIVRMGALPPGFAGLWRK